MHTYDEELFPEGQRVPRQGLSGANLYVIVDGEAAVEIDGAERTRSRPRVQAYLHRVVSFDGGPHDEGAEPLAHFVDAAGPDAVAATVEMNAQTEIYPFLYVRRAGRIDERVLEPDPLNAFDGPDYRAEVDALLAPLL